MKERIWALAILTHLLLLVYPAIGACEYFPTPVAAPQLLVYYDFSRTDFYDPESESLPLIANIISETYKNRLSKSQRDSDLKEKIAQHLRNKTHTNTFKVDKLFFYLADQENFAAILTGNFDRNKIKSLYPEHLITDTDAGTIIKIKINAKTLPNLRMLVSNELIMLAADTTIEAYTDNLNQSKPLLTDKYKTFIDMVNANPLLAAEVSVAGIKQRFLSDNIMLPSWVKTLEHIRFIVDRRLTRLQLVASSDENTEVVRSSINEQLLSFDTAQNFNINKQNRSIFIEARANPELEILAAHHTAAFILHFFVKTKLETAKHNSEVEHAAR